MGEGNIFYCLITIIRRVAKLPRLQLHHLHKNDYWYIITSYFLYYSQVCLEIAVTATGGVGFKQVDLLKALLDSGKSSAGFSSKKLSKVNFVSFNWHNWEISHTRDPNQVFISDIIYTVSPRTQTSIRLRLVSVCHQLRKIHDIW
ncbi:hypothetical protein CAAN1_07S05930 [[Candida] anglica]|uniref:Uncharacterized protein n=1 Tax=[Candida] anglica TaxID=148631 RepID=A0ABP0EEA4_9ASCO